ncbi:hypothetical protein [Accumulibacter sp.]|uniref:chorismate transformation enzyme, FkbO/Hyg5 family n=1 Tax=Accumulibacter sp. TaxID=2053492 RepID=UPI00260BC1CE|nr:hypothetical protein [Accumulibacter sp.]
MRLRFHSDVCRLRAVAGIDPADETVLGGSLIGCPTIAEPRPRWPRQTLNAPLLGHDADFVEEHWLTDGECLSGEFEGIFYRRSSDVLYGVIEIDERTFPDSAAGTALQRATAEAYGRIFRLLATQGLPQLWRVWNYLADINRETGGLERYRQFNVGRYDAFLSFAPGAADDVPAACAIGLQHGPLSIAFIAGRTPARPIENPRQVSAYRYPVEYGPRSPTFSRAVLVTLPEQESLFISGTASIVGYRTVHAGDVEAQCREALANVEALLDESGHLCRSTAFTLSELSYRVYVRRAVDYPAVRSILMERLGETAEAVFIEADICRPDLLVEIEAMASHPLEDCR